MADLDSRDPAFINLYDGTRVDVIAQNTACREMWLRTGYENAAEEPIRSESWDPSMMKTLRKFLDGNEWTVDGDSRGYIMVDNGHVHYNEFRLIAEKGKYRSYLGRVRELMTEDPALPADSGTGHPSADQQRNNILSNLLMSFDNIFICHLEKDYLETWYQDLYYTDLPGTHYHGIKKHETTFCDKLVFPDDRERFKTDTAKLLHVMPSRKSPRETSKERYRVLCSDGQYRWKLFTSFLVPEKDETIIMITMQNSILMRDEKLARFSEKYYRLPADARASVDILFENLSSKDSADPSSEDPAGTVPAGPDPAGGDPAD